MLTFKKLSLAAALTGCMLLGSAVPALAYDRDSRDHERYENRVRREYRPHYEVHGYGEYNRRFERPRYDWRESREQRRWIDRHESRDRDYDRLYYRR